ncbi:MAG: hypothetical protein COB14_02400 [Alphaproteobacteria bacterium]|nr:MAG: hypothetical protein COB14_02400 [Alphaproteobacteria bacterium]
MPSKERIYHYYLLGDRPIKVTCSAMEIPINIEIVDSNKKKFVPDLSLISVITDSMDIRTINENEFRNACLAKGVKPI